MFRTRAALSLKDEVFIYLRSLQVVSRSKFISRAPVWAATRMSMLVRVQTLRVLCRGNCSL